MAQCRILRDEAYPPRRPVRNQPGASEERLVERLQRAVSGANVRGLSAQAVNVRNQSAIHGTSEAAGSAGARSAKDLLRKAARTSNGQIPSTRGRLRREGVASLRPPASESASTLGSTRHATALDGAQLERAMEDGRKGQLSTRPENAPALRMQPGGGSGFEIGFTGAGAIAATPDQRSAPPGPLREHRSGLGHSLGEFALAVAGTLWRDAVSELTCTEPAC